MTRNRFPRRAALVLALGWFLVLTAAPKAAAAVFTVAEYPYTNILTMTFPDSDHFYQGSVTDGWILVFKFQVTAGGCGKVYFVPFHTTNIFGVVYDTRYSQEDCVTSFSKTVTSAPGQYTILIRGSGLPMTYSVEVSQREPVSLALVIGACGIIAVAALTLVGLFFRWRRRRGDRLRAPSRPPELLPPPPPPPPPPP